MRAKAKGIPLATSVSTCGSPSLLSFAVIFPSEVLVSIAVFVWFSVRTSKELGKWAADITCTFCYGDVAKELF